jgi:hypothetical protein
VSVLFVIGDKAAVVVALAVCADEVATEISSGETMIDDDPFDFPKIKYPAIITANKTIILINIFLVIFYFLTVKKYFTTTKLFR